MDRKKNEQRKLNKKNFLFSNKITAESDII